MKKFIALLTGALLTAALGTTAFAADISVTVDGTPVAWTDAKPFINEDSRTLVPLRPIANALGLTVNWNGDTNTASFTDGVSTIDFIVDSPEYRSYMNGYGVYAYTEMDTKAVSKDDRIYAPARYLAESFGYEVGWDQAASTVTIVKAYPFEEEMEENAVLLPEVPEGELTAAFPMTVEAGTEVYTTIAFSGVSFAEDFDIFAYDEELDIDIELLSKGMEYTYATEGYLLADLMPDINTVPGEYPITWTFPSEWFDGATEDIVVSTTLTVTEPSLESAMELVLSYIEGGVFVDEGVTAADVSTIILEENSWLLDESAFTFEVSEGVYDEAAGEWTGSITIFKGENSLSKEVTLSTELSTAF